MSPAHKLGRLFVAWVWTLTLNERSCTTHEQIQPWRIYSYKQFATKAQCIESAERNGRELIAKGEASAFTLTCEEFDTLKFRRVSPPTPQDKINDADEHHQRRGTF